MCDPSQPFFVSDPRPTGERVAEPGLLTGTAGVGLALLAAISPVEPRWDRAMLLSV
jgi:lantibiotic biosynthesis protein